VAKHQAPTTAKLSKSVAPVSKSTSANQEIDGLLSGVAWASTTLAFSFPDDRTDYGKSYSEANQGFLAFTDEQQEAVVAILGSIESLTDLTFINLTGQENDGSAPIRYGTTSKTPEAWAYYPSEKANGGDAWFAPDLFETPDAGTYAYATFMHETGHTLGLKHSFETAGFGPVPKDSLEYTVMSYSSYVGAFDWLNGNEDYPQTLMQYDIAALQHMYGVDTETNGGETTYVWNESSGELTASDLHQRTKTTTTFDAPTTKIFMTVYDGGGAGDTYDFSLWTTPLEIDLRPGEWVSEQSPTAAHTANLNGKNVEEAPVWAAGMIANALAENSLIENAEGGSAGDVLIANSAVNELTGGGGGDTFVWMSLDDLLNGSSGADQILDFSEDDLIDLHNVAGLGSNMVTWTEERGSWVLTGEVAGAEFSLRVNGTATLSSDDFLWA
jgi:serralysin